MPCPNGHETMNANGHCDECGEPFPRDRDGNLPTATGETCPNGHPSKNANGYCDECGKPFPGTE
jgi:RNA polymerase-binding transcription factor DksA